MLVYFSGFSQPVIQNNSFENGSVGDLSGWQWTCNALSDSSAPENGGNWCIKVAGGNVKGCFPGYAYYKITSPLNEPEYILTCWAHSETNSAVGIYFGKINNGIITIGLGDTTSSLEWEQLSVTSNFNLQLGDTAIVVLNGGLTGGPFVNFGYFDLVDLESISGFSDIDNSICNIFPIPFSEHTTVNFNSDLKNATLIVTNLQGIQLKVINNFYGRKFDFFRDNLVSGIYFLQVVVNNKVITNKKILIAE